MYPYSAADIARICSGTVVAGNDAAVASSCFVDSRKTIADSLFAAFIGQEVDGHAYIEVAASKGATIILASRTDIDYVKIADRCATVIVDDVLRALQDLAGHQRNQMNCSVIGITGSSGKTSTKELLLGALQSSVSVLDSGLESDLRSGVQNSKIIATQDNYNNELGVPLTLLRADEKTEILIVEMGMRGLGQITELANIARPTMGIITTIGDAHIEMLGSRENIARAKGELFEFLDADQFAFMPADTDYADYLSSITKAVLIKTLVEDLDEVRQSSVLAPTAEQHLQAMVSCSAEIISYDEQGSATALVKLPFVAASSNLDSEINSESAQYLMNLQMPGKHSVSNALLALAVTQVMGFDAAAAIRGLEAVQPAEMRMQRCQVTKIPNVEKVNIIVDCYNANPESTTASLNTLSVSQLADAKLGKRIAVLGDMLEMGEHSARAHKEILLLAGMLKIDLVYAFGTAYEIATADVLSELSTGRSLENIPEIRAFTDIDLLIDNLISVLTSGSLVLIKGSRGMQMERITDALSDPVIDPDGGKHRC